jgi:hypothetical protein
VFLCTIACFPAPTCRMAQQQVLGSYIQGYVTIVYRKKIPEYNPYLLIQGPSAKKTKDLLRLNRDQLRCVVGLLTGHCHLKGHLFKLGLTADPICKRCLEDDQSRIHILCDCEAVAYTRFHHLGQYFMESSDYYDIPIDKVLHFIRSMGLIKS